MSKKKNGIPKHVSRKLLELVLELADIEIELEPYIEIGPNGRKTGWYWGFRKGGGSVYSSSSTKSDALKELEYQLREKIKQKRFEEARKELIDDLEYKARDRAHKILVKEYPHMYNADRKA